MNLSDFNAIRGELSRDDLTKFQKKPGPKKLIRGWPFISANHYAFRCPAEVVPIFQAGLLIMKKQLKCQGNYPSVTAKNSFFK
jgi:hypothetical protein